MGQKEQRYFAQSEVLAGRSEPLKLNGSDVLVRDYLIALKMPKEKIGTFLDEEGRWSLHRDFLAYMNMEPLELTRALVKDFQPVFEAVDLILVSTGEFGFNSHGRSHVMRTLRYEWKLLEALELPKNEETELLKRRVVFTALTHDLQMVTGRESNDAKCLDFFKLIFGPSVIFNPHFQKISHTISMHSEKMATANPDLVNEDLETLLLLFGDKTDWHRDRTIRTHPGATTLSDDEHMRINALVPHPMEIRIYHNEYDGNRGARIDIHFSRFDDTGEFAQSFYKKDSSDKLLVPERMHRLNKDDGIFYVSSFQSEVERVYGMRLALQAVALFGIFKDLDKLDVFINDYHIQHGTTFWVTREDYLDYFAFIYYMTNKDKIRSALLQAKMPEFPAFLGPAALERVLARYDVKLPLSQKEINE